MNIFDDIHISWNGKKHIIKGDDNIMMLLAKLEDVITAKELFGYLQKKDVPLAKVSQAFSIVLQFVGQEVSPAEIYKVCLFDMEQTGKISGLALALTTMMIPNTEPQAETAPKKGKRKPLKKTQGAK